MNTEAHKSYIWLALIIFGVLFLLVAGGYAAFDIAYAGQVMPGVNLSNKNLGGIKFAEADSIIAKTITIAESQKINLIYQSDSQPYALDQLGIELDQAGTIDNIHRFGRTTNLITNLKQRAGGLFGLTYPTVDSRFNSNFDTVLKDLEKKI